MTAARQAILLTGGSSRRMGFDKAKMEIGGRPNGTRLFEELTAAGLEVLEVGPGVTGAPFRPDETPFSGPLPAISGGWRWLGCPPALLVVACDLVLAGRAEFELLARRESPRSVVPVFEGRVQPLCARWAEPALRRAVELTAAGTSGPVRQPLIETEVQLLIGREGRTMSRPGWCADADTPEELRALTVPA